MDSSLGRTSILATIDDPSKVGEARRRARQLAHSAGFSESEAEKVAIMVTEMSTNALKHAGGGRLWVEISSNDPGPEIEILALDRGPGMSDIDSCLRDGYSTSKSSGTGLGAIRRLSSFSDVYSAPGRGVAIVARMAALKDGKARTRRTAGIQSAKTGEEVCGDAWTAIGDSDRMLIAVADGLGHGPEAARAAQTAMDSAHKYSEQTPKEIVEAMNAALRPTRGAAVAVAALDTAYRTVSFAGLGNVSAYVCEGGTPARHLVSVNGTAGMQARNIREYESSWPEHAVVILHSDGIGTHWDLRDYPGLITRDPALIAGVLFRDHCRGSDDATVVAVR